MKKSHLRKGIITTLTVVITMASAHAATMAMSESDAKDAAEKIAALLVTGRGVVAQHQGLINDASKGNKGFTPEFVEPKIREGFKKITGTDIDDIASPDVKAAVKAALDASNAAIKNNQGRINRQGVAFKGFIPAVYGRVTGNILKGRTGIALKQTTFKYRNEYNRPDDFESAVLQQFESGAIPKGEGKGERVGDSYRFLRPVYIKQACLKCHGDPKGELDISGKPKEGYQLGDLRGAISVEVPIAR